MANLASVTKYFPTPKEGFITTLGSSILSGATTVPLNSTSGLTNGDVFVGLIEPGQTNEQCFTGTVDTAGNQITNVVWTTGTNVAHSAGVTIVDYVTSTTVGMISKGVLKHSNQDGSLTNAAVKAALGITADPTGSWNLLDGGAPTVSSVTANGNRSYTINFASDYSTTLSAGMRLKTTRTVAAPTQCTSLNGSSQYYSKTSPSGMTFTNNFVVSAWIKLAGYSANRSSIVTRTDGTSANGFTFDCNASGQVRLIGYNGGLANVCYITSYQSVPLNKWVHVTAQLDMTVTTNSATTNYIMIDGVDVPAFVTRGGTNPTSLVNTGDLQIGKDYSTNYHNGKIAQVAIYSAKITQANIRATISQGLSGSETSLVSAYSFNGTANDLSATGNNLTAQGSAVATNADSPFGCQADGTISSTLDYSIITKIATTAVTVQVPEGCTIPTTGGISGVSYATVKVPYGFPAQRGKWSCVMISRTQYSQSSAVVSTWYNIGSHKLNVPIGLWKLRYDVGTSHNRVSGAASIGSTLSTANNSESDRKWTRLANVNAASDIDASFIAEHSIELSASTDYYLNIIALSVNSSTLYTRGDNTNVQIYAECELV